MYNQAFTQISKKHWPYLFDKITSWRCPDDFPKRRPDVLRIFQHGPICNAKGHIRRGIYRRPTHDVNSNHNPLNWVLWTLFNISWFQLYIRNCTIKVNWKSHTSYFGSIMVRDVSTKVGPIGNVLRTLCASLAQASILASINACHVNYLWPFHLQPCLQRISYLIQFYSETSDFALELPIQF